MTIKISKLNLHATIWMNFINIILNKRNQMQ